MAKFGTFQYGGLTKEQEAYLGRIKTGVQREKAGAMRKAEKRLAYTGMGRGGVGQAQLGGLAQAYGQKLAETTGGFRQQAAETARQAWLTRRGAEFGAETAAERARVAAKREATESAKERAFAVGEAKKERVARARAAKELKKKSTWDYIREGVEMVGSLV